MLLIICADATPEIGAGHVMRCIALAHSWKALGGQVVFLGRLSIPWVRERILRSGFSAAEESRSHCRISPEEFADRLETVEAGFPSDGERTWVVLDGYHFTPAHHHAARANGRRSLVVDDNNHLPEYEADILFNQNTAAETFRYAGAIGRKCLGHRYVLIRPEFLEAKPLRDASPGKTSADVILATFGGSDTGAFFQDSIAWLRSLDLAGYTLRVVAGESDKAALKRAAQAVAGEVEILDHVENMAELLLDTDFCITAGGSTCWELCYLGIPFAVFSIADNQRDNVRFLEENEICFPKDPAAINSALADMSLFAEHVRRMTALVDGRGAERLCRAMRGWDAPEPTLRRATKDDVHFVFELVNDPLVRETAFTPGRISFETHQAWFARFLESDDIFLIAERGGQPCGYVRFEHAEGGLMITIAVGAESRGGGIGKDMLRKGCALAARIAPGLPFLAYVKAENLPSQNLFLSVGFRRKKRLVHRSADVWSFELQQVEQ
ncbi:UDP-2,4-diacetamido-2,4,6-trideoxy-beta-L-altropyranose hydrolase [Paucidesulfovibrio longus]|uniref:UDP-2,4-diacetamido-2,4, 6-trideoxy-beta-L-altropyranose hydrolase n=1 Tax=Paucidesulfovibrio longus TaxID=889 RepID=UPI0003B484A3|nr:UDP-2,4-diacetamido-2,4,6-trideoxy-beta-L-altropyranose hydrolase [Paucidesulfovibrio longus]